MIRSASTSAPCPTGCTLTNYFLGCLFRCAAVFLVTISTGKDLHSQDSPPALTRFQESFPQMGVEFEVIFYAEDQSSGKQAMEAVKAHLAFLNSLLSDYDTESELSRLGRRAPTEQPIGVSHNLWEVLAASKEVETLSDGSFDVTVGPLTKLWRSSRRRKEPPTSEYLEKAMAASGGKYLALHPITHSVSLSQPQMRLDLGGIAKGYATDEGLRVLAQHGITRALVRASGDISAGDPPPDRSSWKVGIAPLHADEPPTLFLGLVHQAVSTSGDSQQFLVVNGVRHSHIVDPKTGWGVTGRSSVTVVGPRGIFTDSLASAVSIQGGTKGLQMLQKKEGYAALVVADESPAGDGETLRWYATPGFEKLLIGGKLPDNVQQVNPH